MAWFERKRMKVRWNEDEEKTGTKVICVYVHVLDPAEGN